MQGYGNWFFGFHTSSVNCQVNSSDEMNLNDETLPKVAVRGVRFCPVLYGFCSYALLNKNFHRVNINMMISTI